jgi:hypothetical protein
MDNDIEMYIELHKKQKELRKEQKGLKEKIVLCDARIMEYMTSKGLDSISHKDASISLYNKKTSQKFKKDVIQSKIEEKIGNSEKAREIAESVCTNNQCVVKEAIKVSLKN